MPQTRRSSGGKEHLSLSETTSGDTPKETLSWGRKTVVFMALACINVISSMCFALIAPIFPQVAKSKGVSLSVQGWIFGIVPLAQCVSAPIFGILIPHMGAKFAFVWGTIFASGCCVLFGCLVWIEDTMTFTVYCFVVRIFMAIGTGSSNTAVFVIVMKVWPDDVAFTLGSLESIGGIGLMLGPALGGILFDLGGFFLPFVVVGVTNFILAVISAAALPRVSNAKVESGESSISVFSLLSSVKIVIITLSCSGIAFTWLSLDPTLQPHLEKEFGFSATQVGLAFLIPALTYAITGPFVGKLVDRMDNSLPLMIFGFFTSGICCWLLGPTPLFNLQGYQKVWLNFTYLAGLGIACAFGLNPVYERLITFTKQAGYPENTATMSAIGSLFWLACSSGDYLGPVVSDVLVENVGYQWCMTVVGAIPICLGFLLVALWMFTRGNDNKSESEPSEESKLKDFTKD